MSTNTNKKDEASDIGAGGMLVTYFQARPPLSNLELARQLGRENRRPDPVSTEPRLAQDDLNRYRRRGRSSIL